MPPGGYAWWYLDALSDDGRHGLTIIAFLGSVFSPYYAAARRRAAGGAADPLQHCAVNVALYEPGRSWWSMTERGRRRLERDPGLLCIGTSRLERTGDGLQLRIDERAVPWPARLKGAVRLHAPPWQATTYPLDAAGFHRWTPLAPRARVSVEMSSPTIRWEGEAYLDQNQGDRPLERDVRHWHWCRAHLADGRSIVLYDTVAWDGRAATLALEFDGAGRAGPVAAPPRAPLPDSRWRLVRECRSDAGTVARVRRGLEDGPFYARSLVEATWHGEPVVAMQETLSMSRFARRWVQLLLPFRMPRRSS